MKQMNFEVLTAYGIDWKDGLARCMNDEALYAKILSLFLQDRAYSSAVTALQSKDYPAMFRFLHDLKGSSGNAGLVKLNRAVSPLVETLRGGNCADAIVNLQFADVTSAYDIACSGIGLLQL